MLAFNGIHTLENTHIHLAVIVPFMWSFSLAQTHTHTRRETNTLAPNLWRRLGRAVTDGSQYKPLRQEAMTTRGWPFVPFN